MNADRTFLTNSTWAELSPSLPGQANGRGSMGSDTGGFVGAVLWLGRAGVGWQDLPPNLGYWHRVYVRFARWSGSGVWERVAHWLIAHNRRLPHPRQRPLRLDSTSTRVPRHAAGAAKKRPQAIGRSRGARTSKLHVSTAYVFTLGDYFFACPNNYYVNYYKDTFQHGGISLKEVIFPFITLSPKG